MIGQQYYWDKWECEGGDGGNEGQEERSKDPGTSKVLESSIINGPGEVWEGTGVTLMSVLN